MTGYHQYKLCIEACMRCAALCKHAVVSSLKETDPAIMVKCVQLALECAAICTTTAELMSLGSDKVAEMAKICATIADACAEEFSKHTNEHSQECAEACTKCADECEVIQTSTIA